MYGNRGAHLREPLNVLRKGPHPAPVVVVEELHHGRVDGVVRRNGAEEVWVLFLVCQNWSGGRKRQLDRGEKNRVVVVRTIINNLWCYWKFLLVISQI